MGRKGMRTRSKPKDVPIASHKRKTRNLILVPPVASKPPEAPRPPPSFYREKIQLLWAVHHLRLRLSPNVLRVVCGEYLGLFIAMAIVLPKKICMDYDCIHKVWQRSYELIDESIRSDSSILLLGGTRSFVCGSLMKSRQAFLLEKGWVELATKMIEKHMHPGLVYEPRTASVYVFGGSLGSVVMREEFTRRSEKYFVKGDVWRRLPDMPAPLGKFNPCLYQCFIYLIGCRETVMHAYDSFTNQYTAFPPLPSYVDRDTNFSITCFAYHDKITILHSNCITQWDSYSWTTRKFQSTRFEFWSRCPPAVYQDSVYIASGYIGYCIEFNLQTMTVVK